MLFLLKKEMFSVASKNEMLSLVINASTKTIHFFLIDSCSELLFWGGGVIHVEKSRQIDFFGDSCGYEEKGHCMKNYNQQHKVRDKIEIHFQIL